jgi:L-threonylcarbamoyladenylate synthase
MDSLERVADLSLLDKKAREKLFLLAGRFWPGPLTLILPRQRELPDLATSGLATAALRFPDHWAARQLIARSTGAVAAPSANPFGYLSPTRAEHVRDQLGERVDIILDGGPARLGLESTVLDLSGEPRILRPGGVPGEDIEALIGPLSPARTEGAALPVQGKVMAHNEIVAHNKFVANNEAMPQISPGQLTSHYAPRRPLFVHSREEMAALPAENGAALLFFDGSARDAWLAAHAEAGPVITLSETGDLREAAARLFETLHSLDSAAVSRIHAQLAPEQGLGAAINDRLRRGACSRP